MNGESAHIIRAIESLEVRFNRRSDVSEKRSEQHHVEAMGEIGKLHGRITRLYERQANGGTADAKTEAILRAHIVDCHRHRRVKWRVTLVCLGAAATVAGGVVLSLITG